MTVPSTTRKAGPYAGNGVTTSFPFGFKVFAKSDVAVVLTDSNGSASTPILDSDYSITLNADQDANPGGSVTYPILVGPSPLPVGSTLTMIGGLAAEQGTDLTNGGRYLPNVIEGALDKLTILIQQLKEVSNRTLQAAVGTTVSLIFPAPSSGKFIRWRSDLLGLENVDAGTDSMALQGLLADAGDVTHGSALIGYKLNATSSTGRTLAAKIAEDWISVKDFGAVGNGVTDDTLAIQAAINYAGPIGRRIFFPRGSYIYSGVTVSANRLVHFVGEHRGSTFLLLSSGTATGFNCQTDQPVIFESLTFGYKASVTGTAGAFISIPGATAGNYNSRFADLQMNAPWVGIATSGAASWTADRVSIGEYISAAFTVQNTFSPDHGDSTIINCQLATSSATAIGILQRSSGGLRIVNNKILGGAYYYQLILDSGVNTSDLIVIGNSMEGSITAGLEFRRAAASGSFSNIIINGNQFAGGPNVIHLDESTAGWLNNVTISGNNLTVQGNAGITINAAGIFSITGNTLRGVLGTEIGIQIAAAAASGIIGGNVFQNFATALSNASATTAVQKRVLQGTTSNITCSNAFGAVYEGTVAVTFPAGFFGSTPKVMASIDSGTAGLGAGALSATTGGVTIRGVDATNGAVVTCTWRAEADY